MPGEVAPGVIEGQTLQADLDLSPDVCIIGSGAGGAVAAALLQQAGLKVVVLEEGGYFTSTRFRMREDECYPQLYQESAQRTTKDVSVSIFQGRAVGGTTVVNWTTCFRTPASTLERWNRTHGAAAITAEGLAPHFRAIEQRLHIQKIPLADVNRNNRLLWDGCQALDFGVETLHRNVKQCIQSGYCGMGCPVDAKQSMLVSFLPDAVDAGATVVSRCRATRLVYEAGRVARIEGALLDAWGLKPTGVRLVVRPKYVILSAGAIGTPAVLLRSGTEDPHDRIGRRTFLHPVIVSAGEYDEPVAGYRGAPQGVASHHFADRGDEVGYFLEAAPIYPLLLATAFPGFGPAHRTFMTKLPNLAAHIALAIDGHHEGEEGGRVVLRPSGAPVLDYTVSAKTWSALRQAQHDLARLQLETGARAVYTLHYGEGPVRSSRDLAQVRDRPFGPHDVGVFSAHQMGGAGISDDPQRGVVRSEDLRHHHVRNLHVIDGSVFPTSAGVNPQLSIYGLAHWTASRLAAAWA